MAHVERTAVSAQRATHGLDRAVNAGAKSPRLGQDYFFDVMFTQRHQGSCLTDAGRSVNLTVRAGMCGLSIVPKSKPVALAVVFFFLQESRPRCFAIR